MIYRAALALFFTILPSFEVPCAAHMEANDAFEKHYEAFEKSPNPCKEIDHKYAVDNQRFRRVVVLSQDTTYTDPLVDPNHELALTMKLKNGDPLYTQADIDDLEIRAYNELYNKYGVDARFTTPNASGIRVVPGVGLGLPILIGRQKQFYLVLDTKNPERDQNVSNRWVNVEVDVIFQFTAPYTVPNGFEMAGAQAQAGYLFAYGDLNLLKNASTVITDLTFSERELLTFTTDWLNTVAPDQWGNPSYSISTQVEDEYSHVGTYLASTARLREPPGASVDPEVSLQERPVIVWDCPQSCLPD
jgi:hypothetical protein